LTAAKRGTAAFRYDMDALPIRELKSAATLHPSGQDAACGHDGHMAMLLQMARYAKNPVQDSRATCS
jgi:hippurate hydrolase